MPYTIKSTGSGAVLLKHGKVVSHHASKEKAEAAIRAIYANELPVSSIRRRKK